MNQVNYQLELDKILDRISDQHKQGGTDQVPTLFLHSCCAPCSSYVLEYLAPFFALTVFYYNPNISELEEYRHRVTEQKRLIERYNREGKGYRIEVIEGDYRPASFYEAVKGYEDCPEGGERCFHCYEMRLRETAMQAEKRNMDYFGTTLTISPLKNAAKLNEIGYVIEAEFDDAKRKLRWLPSDFKKRGGYQRSIALSKEYDLYRQDFCGCSFSKYEKMKKKALQSNSDKAADSSMPVDR